MESEVLQKLCSAFMYVATMTTAGHTLCLTAAEKAMPEQKIETENKHKSSQKTLARKVHPPPVPIDVVTEPGSLSSTRQRVEKYKDAIQLQETNGAVDYPITYALEKEIKEAVKGSNKGDRYYNEADHPQDVWKTRMEAHMPKSQVVPDEIDDGEEDPW